MPYPYCWVIKGAAQHCKTLGLWPDIKPGSEDSEFVLNHQVTIIDQLQSETQNELVSRYMTLFSHQRHSNLINTRQGAQEQHALLEVVNHRHGTRTQYPRFDTHTVF